MYTARRLGPPKFSKVRSEMHSQLLYSFGLCLFGAGCSIAPPPSLTKLAVIVLLVSPLCRAILRLGSSLFSSLCSPVSWKSFKICLNVIGHVSIGWDMNDGANGMVRPLYATWHRNGAFLQRTCSIQTAQWIEALESLAAGSHHQLWWICWGPEGLEPKSEQQIRPLKSERECLEQVFNYNHLQLFISVVQVSTWTFGLHLFISRFVWGRHLSTGPWKIWVIYLYMIIYILWGKQVPTCLWEGGEQTKDEHIWTYDETCISSISMCTTYTHM